MLKYFAFVCLTGLSMTAIAQKKSDTPPATGSTVASTATPSSLPKQGPKPYKEVITDKAKTQKGLFTVHKIEDKYYFEIADSVMGHDIMAVTRFVKTTANAGFGGEEANRQMIRFEKGLENKVFLRSVTIVNYSADSTKPMFQAVKNSNLDPIIGVFDMKAVRKDTSVVIDVSDYFKGDNQVFSIDPQTKNRYKLTSLMSDRSFVQNMKAYPINIEIKTLRTFGVTPPSPVPSTTPSVTLPAGADAGVVTMEFNTSLIMLPKNPMRKRYFDNRVGYFANGYTVFGEDSHKTEHEVFAVRWRLEPKNAQDAELQKKGTLIEPKKPIVFYIDPATPKKWRKYLIDGINDWQSSFEQAGWKNAIRGEEFPENDSTMSLEDARFSAIRYFAADIENAYGPNVHDPRTGEIIESHIGWYHNVMNLLHKWFFIQTAAANPAARKPKFDDELMGQLIRFVSSHEVGHTLGLRHNFGSSHTTPVEKLRDKNWVAKNGHTPSIMDYARFNYVAQPEDGVTDFFPRIGDYDKWAIEWGYKYFADAKSAEDEKKLLNKQVVERVAANPRLWFGTEVNPYDPRSQSECLGDNNMKASEYGIKNLQRIVPNLITWTKEEGENYELLSQMYDQIFGQYRRYVGHVLKNIGGIYETPKNFDEVGSVYEPTPKDLQKEAVSFLNKQLFETPNWLFDANVLNKIKPDQGLVSIGSLQEAVLANILNTDRLGRIIETSNKLGVNGYSLDELMSDVKNGIWVELKTKKAIDLPRRNLQKVYTEKLISMLNPAPVPPQGGFNFYGFSVTPYPVADAKKSDIVSIARGYLIGLKAEIAAILPLVTDKMSKYHLQDVQFRIGQALEPR